MRGLPSLLRRKPTLHFMHIGKTGGSAIAAAVEGLETAEYRVERHGHAFALNEVRGRDRCFFFVRDPLTRFVSGFYSRQRKGQPRIYSPWTPDEEVAFGTFSTPNELARALSDGDEGRRAAAVAAMGAIIHVRDHYSRWLVDEAYLRRRLPRILFVGAQEHLDDDFARLKELLGLPDPVRLPDDDVAAHRNPRHLDYTLDDTAAANLRAWYAPDYPLLDALAEAFPGVPRYER